MRQERGVAEAKARAWVKPTPYAHVQPTYYRGQRFRSRAEAQVAQVLDALGWEWQYEPRVFRFPVRQGNVQFSPDFRVFVPELGERWFEVKGYLSPDSITKIHRFCKYFPHEAVRLVLLTDERRRLQKLLGRREVQEALAHGLLLWSLRRFLRLPGGGVCLESLVLRSGS